MSRGLTAKQRVFADEYLKDGNAYQAAIKAGYSDNYAKAQSSKLLENVGIKSYIDAKMSEIESKKIATAREVMEFYARVLRGDETEEVVVAGLDGAEVVERKPQLKERITVAKEIMKRYPLAGNDPALAEQLRKIKAEADIAEWKAKELLGDNTAEDKTTLIDDIGGEADGANN
ncbi:MAG: terminase small subunit [Ligilactobacillus ruminis]|nr:terminase small subunit [Ligilactobacillus ruminis]